MSESDVLNANAYLEDTLRMKIGEIRRVRLEAAYQQASQDPEFLADMAATTAAFETTVGDGLDDLPE